MTDAGELALRPAGPAEPRGLRLALASRGDALTPYLFEALERRFPVVGRVDPELSRLQRLAVAGLTFRPRRSDWMERFYKSGTARALRSRNAARQLRNLPAAPEAVLQVHLLFEVTDAPAMIYVDCTHHQTADRWPQWNPLRGSALRQWYEQEQRAYDAAAHLFAFCEPARDSLVLDYGIDPARITVVGAGANLRRPPEPAPRTTAPTVLFIGNDFVRKGGPELLEAFRAVRDRIPEARLVLVGTLPPIAPEPGVEVLGRIDDRTTIERLYSEAAVFVMPSHFDPYGLVLLEAMSFGLPVVATRQTAVPEIVEDGRTGRLVEPGDVVGLADALLHVLEHPDDATRWGSAGRRRVEQHFTWDAVVDRMAPALQQAAAGTR